jgi:hypothetical protein
MRMDRFSREFLAFAWEETWPAMQERSTSKVSWFAWSSATTTKTKTKTKTKTESEWVEEKRKFVQLVERLRGKGKGKGRREGNGVDLGLRGLG